VISENRVPAKFHVHMLYILRNHTGNKSVTQSEEYDVNQSVNF